VFEHKRWFRGGRDSRSELHLDRSLGGSCGENAGCKGREHPPDRARRGERPAPGPRRGGGEERTRCSWPWRLASKLRRTGIPPRCVASDSGELEKEPGDGERTEPRKSS